MFCVHSASLSLVFCAHSASLSLVFCAHSASLSLVDCTAQVPGHYEHTWPLQHGHEVDREEDGSGQVDILGWGHCYHSDHVPGSIHF